MKLYNLMDITILKKNKEYLFSSMFGAFLIIICGLILMFAVEGDFLDGGIYILMIFFLLALPILIYIPIIHVKYNIKIAIDDNLIKVYRKNKYQRTFNLDEFKYQIKDVVIFLSSRYQKEVVKSCLILYKDIELYDKMEYRSYWNEDNILIIQNKILIDEILKKFNKH